MSVRSESKSAVFFVSTGRCGTQWFAHSLGKHFSDQLVASHEPFQIDYQPRRLFRAYHNGQRDVLPEHLEAHFDDICRTIEQRHYVEAGWTSYGALPTFLERFQGRVKVVHLVRHPVRVAASLITHNVYRRGRWSDAVAITPDDDGVSQPELAGASWAAMSDFEKCLFWWTELNGHALRLRESFADTPWLSLSYEDVFGEQSEPALRRLLDFLELKPQREFFLSVRRTHDNFQKRTAATFDIDSLDNYPETLAVMDQLGYQADEVQVNELEQRYRWPLWDRVVARLPGTARKLARAFRPAA